MDLHAAHPPFWFKIFYMSPLLKLLAIVFESGPTKEKRKLVNGWKLKYKPSFV